MTKMETKPTEISSTKMFGGYNKRYKHFSPTLGCSMTFHIFFPPSPNPSHKFPVSSTLFFSLFCFRWSKIDNSYSICKFHTRSGNDIWVFLIVPYIWGFRRWVNLGCDLNFSLFFSFSWLVVCVMSIIP